METQLLTIELKSKTKRKEKDHISHTKTEETHYGDEGLLRNRLTEVGGHNFQKARLI